MQDVTAKLRECFKQDLTNYRAIPFWSWNNELDEQKLVEQIDQMHEAGMGGFIMHARLGLTTEYLGEKWFSCIDACLKRAKQLGMNAWVYDENGWPSGFVGGKLLENEKYRAKFLEYKVTEQYDENAFAVFCKGEGGFKRITASVSGLSEYHCVYLRVSPANTDILDPEVVDAFINETHEQYYKRFKNSFGKELTGFFTDEPQYYRWATPFSPHIQKEYEKRFAGDIKDGLIWLFVHDERGYEFRMRYYTIANDLYTDNFYKKLYDWCEAHNCKLTGHSIEENNLGGQMLGGAGCMPTYEYEHIPGIDLLGAFFRTELGAKQVSSVASQLGIKSVLTETYGCAGNDTDPRRLKQVGEFQYFNGVTLMCHHLYPYSMAGQAKHDHPPIFSKHSNWWEGFREFNDYFTKLGYIISNTEEQYDLLVIHPLRNVYLEWVREQAGESVKEIELNFKNTLDRLCNNGITYQLADERILAKHGRVENGDLFVGKNKYDCVLVPNMKNISSTTLQLLNQYKGKLYCESELLYIDGKKQSCNLSSNVTFEQIVKDAKVRIFSSDGLIRTTARSGEIGDFLFVKNYSLKHSKKVCLKDYTKGYKSINLQNLTVENLANECVLPPYEGLILIRDESAKPQEKTNSVYDATGDFSVVDITDNYLVNDYCSISFDGVNFSNKEFNQKHFEKLLRDDYKGKLYIRYTFKLNELMPLKLVLEKARFFSVKVNGKEVALGESSFDFNYCEGDITDCVRVGENEFVYGIDYYQHEGVHFALFDPMATESLRNCLYYDTHIENVYLKGDFTVCEDFSLTKREKMPKLSTKNHLNGYPFFKGNFKIVGNYNYDGNGERIISLMGKYQMAKVQLNGKTVNVVLNEHADITNCLKVGDNQITITVYSSLRNIFGPHHVKREIEEISGINPMMFTMRGMWASGTPDFYNEKHVTVPFGVDKIEIVTKK